jgi:dimethylaniline monooxygenase (N-oxide forming)
MKKVAVIGAGVSGITSVKVCKDYGFDVVCFEKSEDIGGLWRYKPGDCEGEASVMKTTIINTSKEMMAFSDFPPPADLPNFMHHSNVLNYFRSYAEKFGVIGCIRFKTEVSLIKRSARYDETGEWDVTFTDLKTGETSTETFSGVLIANGHHAEPYTAHFEGLDKFQGKIMHSHSYKDHNGYEDKRIVIVGIGNSGGDIAVELGRIAKQVYLVIRSGNWCLTRVAIFGFPFDMNMQTRLFSWLLHKCPSMTNSVVEFLANLRFSHELYGMKCKHRLFNQHPMVNDDLANRIASGTVITKPNIREFTKTGVIFEDGSVADDIDIAMICTGYTIGFPVLEKDLIKVDDNKLTLYKLMYPPQLKHPTLSIIGLIQPWGAIMPISEMQARLACEVLTKRVRLPTPDVMIKVAEQYHDKVRERYGGSRRHTIQVDYLPYMDDLSKMIGARPRISNYIFKDPRLATTLAFGAAAPYQFRLEGPQTWSGAREALMTVWDRALHQMKSGRHFVDPNEERGKLADFKKVIFIFFALALVWFAGMMAFV